MDMEAREQAVERWGDMVWRLALARTADIHDAEDVFQEVFERFFRHENRLESEEHRKAWLIRCTINRAKSVLTSPWRRRTQPLETAERAAPESGEDEREVYAAVLALPPGYRAVIHLYYYEGLSVAEIARAAGCAEGTVKSRLSRGRELLRRALKEVAL